jgi:hypothetical protein
MSDGILLGVAALLLLGSVVGTIRTDGAPVFWLCDLAAIGICALLLAGCEDAPATGEDCQTHSGLAVQACVAHLHADLHAIMKRLPAPKAEVTVEHTDVEGCEARYAALHNEYVDLRAQLRLPEAGDCEQRCGNLIREYEDLVATYTDERRCPAFQRCLKAASEQCFFTSGFWCMPGPNLPPVCAEGAL